MIDFVGVKEGLGVREGVGDETFCFVGGDSSSLLDEKEHASVASNNAASREIRSFLFTVFSPFCVSHG